MFPAGLLRAKEHQLRRRSAAAPASRSRAARTQFGRRVAHGLYSASLISAVLGTRLPGPGAIYIAQTLNFRAPVKIGDTMTVVVAVA